MNVRILALATAALMLSSCGGRQTGGMAPQMLPPAARAWRAMTASSSGFKVLHRFGHFTHTSRDRGGASPAGLLDVGGTLYGTTAAGGLGRGTVYAMTPTGVKKTLYRFSGSSDGASPNSGLIAVNGVLYGTTSNGGTCGQGIVYSLTTTGTETVLHDFCGTDGMNPPGGLTDVKGTFYGTTFQGGAPGSEGWGTVYSLTTPGTFKVLHFFPRCGKNNPCGLSSGLVYRDGLLYGTTIYGGGIGCTGDAGCGTVYSVSLNGKEREVYTFRGGSSDGWFPTSSLIDVDGTFYGTTYYGGQGQSGCNAELTCGVIYSLTPAGREKVLYEFAGGSDGGNPDGALVEKDGTFYGTTVFGGGTANLGTVFSFNASAGEKLLHSFSGPDGSRPGGAPLIDVNGTLYGTTPRGGRIPPHGGDGGGTVFALSP